MEDIIDGNVLKIGMDFGSFEMIYSILRAKNNRIRELETFVDEIRKSKTSKNFTRTSSLSLRFLGVSVRQTSNIKVTVRGIPTHSSVR